MGGASRYKGTAMIDVRERTLKHCRSGYCAVVEGPRPDEYKASAAPPSRANEATSASI